MFTLHHKIVMQL